ncbi:MAG: hypothetical protein K9G36_01640 [Crocinitomicaceae bacterium]|nr:hypothetical protein [Crocinitomicaceae bacterium]MCF8444258.1 hypothetical protein [Crocinitomicaceae bacterium]
MSILTFVSCSNEENKKEFNIKNASQNFKPVSQEKDTERTVKHKNEEKKLDFNQLYPILKKSLLKEICEIYHPYKLDEQKNTLKVYSKESNVFVTSWIWDLKKSPIKFNDLDNDGVMDYTIELSNTGGGCGSQFYQQQRWTLFGSSMNFFVLTHAIDIQFNGKGTDSEWVKVK